MKKCIVRVVLSPQHKEILDNICRKLDKAKAKPYAWHSYNTLKS